jgi:hypothetical protein
LRIGNHRLEPSERRLCRPPSNDLQILFGFVGAALFLFVDKYERDGTVANLLKFLVLVVGGIAILHKLKPFGLALF